MWTTMAYGFWEEWELREKVDFDGANKLIKVYPDVTVLDIQVDVWSAWVRWRAILDRGNDRYEDAMDFSGYDEVPDGRGGTTRTGLSYFLTNGWRLVIDFSRVAIFGVLFSRDFETAYYTEALVGQKPAVVSSLVNTVITTTNVVTGDLATTEAKVDAMAVEVDKVVVKTDTIPEDVWSISKSALEANTDSIGYFIAKKLLTIGKFIGLK